MEMEIKFNQSVEIPRLTIEKILKSYMVDNYGTSWDKASLKFKIERDYVNREDEVTQLISVTINQKS